MWELTSNNEQNEKRILAIKETVQNVPAIKEKLAKNEQDVATVKEIEAKQYARKQAQWDMMKRFGICRARFQKQQWNADCDLVIQGNKKGSAGILRLSRLELLEALRLMSVNQRLPRQN